MTTEPRWVTTAGWSTAYLDRGGHGLWTACGTPIEHRPMVTAPTDLKRCGQCLNRREVSRG